VKLSAAIGILIEVASASDMPAGTELYLFGSSLHGGATPNDVDVLLVYPDGHLCQAHRLAESFRNAPAPSLVDVLALSSSEERELALVQTERASPIWRRVT
jgi:predicted nucleotidyltransferase